MENLPLELNTNIIVRLPVKTLGQLKCVSKHFKSLITTDYFIKTQLLLVNSNLHTLDIFHHDLHQTPSLRRRLPVDHLPGKNCRLASRTQLVGSCNGLVCLYNHRNTYTFLNPTTKEFRVLPNPPRTILPNSLTRVSGFGYVSLCDDYKVVSIGVAKYTWAADLVARVYSAKVDSWKTVLTPVSLWFWYSVKSVYVNGVVHWLCSIDRNVTINIIMGFDLADEKFKILNINQSNLMGLGVLGGCICTLSRQADHSSALDMWVMMEYGIEESWIKTFSLQITGPRGPFRIISPICYVGDEVLFVADFKGLVLYDPVKQTITTKLEVNNFSEADVDVAMYEDSFVSPWLHLPRRPDIARAGM